MVEPDQFSFLERFPSACLMTPAGTSQICAWNRRAKRLLSFEIGDDLSEVLPNLKLRRLQRRLSAGEDFQVLLEASQPSSQNPPLLVRAHRIEDDLFNHDMLEIFDATRVLGDVDVYRSYAHLMEVNQRKMELRLSSFPQENRDWK